MAHQVPEMGDPTIIYASGRRVWLFPDGRTLPVVSGGADDDTGDDTGSGDDADKADDTSGDDSGDGDVSGLKAALAAERKAAREAKARAAKAEKDLADARKATMTADEKALEEAKEAGRLEARTSLAERLVDAEIKAAAANRLTDKQRAALLDGLDRKRYLTEDGDVDTEKVKALIDGIAPEKGARDIGQGRRQGGAKPTVASGAELYGRLRNKSKTTT